VFLLVFANGFFVAAEFALVGSMSAASVFTPLAGAQTSQRVAKRPVSSVRV
jgi:hypothetical protein